MTCHEVEGFQLAAVQRKDCRRTRAEAGQPLRVENGYGGEKLPCSGHAPYSMTQSLIPRVSALCHSEAAPFSQWEAPAKCQGWSGGKAGTTPTLTDLITSGKGDKTQRVTRVFVKEKIQGSTQQSSQSTVCLQRVLLPQLTHAGDRMSDRAVKLEKQ